MVVSADGPTSVKPYSIADLVDVYTGKRQRRWRLSNVQRNQVWRGLQVGYLLDSLLWGYPIGSILLCRVVRDGSVRVKRGGSYERQRAGKHELQLLDGQQRMNALGALFARGTEPEARRFLLSLTKERDRHDLTRRRTSMKRTLRYIQVQDADAQADESVVETRSNWLDVSGLYDASRKDGFPDAAEVASRQPGPTEYWLDLGTRIDPDCVFEEDDSELRTEAAGRIQRLLTAWHAKSVPVVTLSLQDPTDVLQVFHRVNRAGTAVSGDDIFFAAVRTVWHDAEKNIERVSSCASPVRPGSARRLLPPIDALRLLARTAALKNGTRDVVPLDVERLRRNKQKGKEIRNELVPEMMSLSEDRDFRERLKRFVNQTVRRSKLGYGLHEIPKRLLDPVLAWAALHREEVLDDSYAKPAWDFLVGATAFRYLSVFGPAFEGVAMKAAIEAGRKGHRFPTEQIVDECRSKWPQLRLRRGVLRVDDDRFHEGRELVYRNATLFLCIAQKVPFHLPEGRTVEIEHLFPQAKMRSAMCWYGPQGEAKKPRKHEDARYASRAGNLCVLDGSLNRDASDKWPDTKLAEVYPRKSRWPSNLFLNSREQKLLLDASEELRKATTMPRDEGWKAKLAKPVGAGMERFVQYVAHRERRIYEAVVSEFPGVIEFGTPRGAVD